MAGRKRLTWQNEGGGKAASEQPVLPVERAASAHPATPDEGPAFPGYEPDPEPDDYMNGDPSSWAEDPMPGPYENSAHPATPDEGPASPAYKEAAEELYARTERKAAKCIRVATQLLAGITNEASVIEDQALDLMHLSDDALDSTLDRLASLVVAEDDGDADEDDETEEVEVEEVEEEDEDGEASKQAAEDEALLRRLLAEEGMFEADVQASDDDEALLRRLLAEEGMDEDEDEGKEASADKSATEQILAALAGITARLDALEGKKAEMDDVEPEMEEADEPVDDEDAEVEAMLQAMLEAEAEADVQACGGEDSDVAACGDEPVLDDEPVLADEPEPVVEPDLDVEEPSLDVDYDVEDPMGVLDEDVDMDENEEALLSRLFANDHLAADAEDSEGGKSEDKADSEAEDKADSEAEDKGESKEASLKPRPKKASRGVTRLGGVQKEASSEISELERLWAAAPDISKVFN